MQVGKAIPLSSFLDFLLLNTLVNSSSIKVSTVPQTVEISAPSTQSARALSSAASATTAAALCLSRIAGVSMND